MTSYHRAMKTLRGETMQLENIPDKPLKPAEFAERKLVGAILDSTFASGQPLPAERELAKILGVTRPTLRETLQKLARDGWVTIRHGKPTLVNDYMDQGGLGVLKTLARLGKRLPNEMISNLLHFRCTLFPGIAIQAAQKDPDAIQAYLEQSGSLTDDPKEFSVFDWGLQLCMARATKNPVFILMLNDFTTLYETLGQEYFRNNKARKASRAYYDTLEKTINRRKNDIGMLVQQVMKQAEMIWQENNENR